MNIKSLILTAFLSASGLIISVAGASINIAIKGECDDTDACVMITHEANITGVQLFKVKSGADQKGSQVAGINISKALTLPSDCVLSQFNQSGVSNLTLTDSEQINFANIAYFNKASVKFTIKCVNNTAPPDLYIKLMQVGSVD